MTIERPAGRPGPAPVHPARGRRAVYMPACINRIFGNDGGAKAHPTLPEALVAISQRAGLTLWIPDDVVGHCCGTPWSSKGLTRGHELMAQGVRAALAGWSDGGRLPVVVDASSCTLGLLSEVATAGPGIREANPLMDREAVAVVDSIEWVHDHLLSSGCCGMAGDRGWLHPDLPGSSLSAVAAELAGRSFDACLSSNRTCEVALREVTGQAYASFVLALEEVIRG